MCLQRFLTLSTHREPFVRAFAAGGLASGESLSVRATHVLRDRALDDVARLVRIIAAGGLSDHGLIVQDMKWMAHTYEPEALAAAIESLRHGNLMQVRAAAAEIVEYPHVTACPALIAALDDGDNEVTHRALEALGKIGHYSAVAAVGNQLFSADQSIRRRAARALGGMGSPEATMPLVVALVDENEDDDDETKIAAAMALGAVGDARAVDALSENMTNGKRSVRVRRACGQALVDLQEPVSLDHGCAALRDPDKRVRAHAANLLRRTPGDTTADALVTTLADSDPFVVAEAVESLYQMISSEIPGHLRSRDPRTSAIRPLLLHPDQRVRRRTMRLLGQLRDPDDAARLLDRAFHAVEEHDRRAAGHVLRNFDPADILADVRNGLGDPRPEVRESSAWIVGEVGIRGATPQVLVLTCDEVAKVREAALWALVTLNADEAGDVALRLSSDPDPNVQWWALWGLGEAGKGAAARNALLGGLASGSSDLRERAASAFAKFGDPQVNRELTAALGDNDPSVRKAALAAIGQLRQGGEKSVSPVLAHDSNEEVRKSAATALGELRDDWSICALVLGGRDRHYDVRRAAAYALKSCQVAGAREVAVALVDDASRKVRRAAVNALGELDRDNGCRSILGALNDVYFKIRREACQMLQVGGDEACLVPLQKATSDPHPAVSAAATEALEAARARSRVSPRPSASAPQASR